MADGSHISIRKFAEIIGVSDTAVRKAIQRGEFIKGFDVETKTIDQKEALKNPWVKAQGVQKPKAGVSRVKVIEKIEKTKRPAKAERKAEDIKPPKVDSDGNTYIEGFDDVETDELIKKLKIYPGMPAHDAMRINEIIDAALNRKKLEEAEGILVRRDKMERALFVMGSELKKALFNMPQRIIRDIMAATNEVEALNVFNSELTQILDTYGNLELK